MATGKNKNSADKSAFNPEQFKIEKGIAMVGVRTIESWRNYPFDGMQPGESFLIPEGNPLGVQHRLSHAINAYTALPVNAKKQFLSRASKDAKTGDPNGRRVWRTK